MNYQEKLATELKEYQTQILTGNVPGISSGYTKLDRAVGKIEPGHIWLVGGKSGVGKTFFVQNLAHNYASQGNKVIIFSTELSVRAYAIRHGMMLGGVYKLQFENDPTKYKDDVSRGFVAYLSLVQGLIIYSVTSLEEVIATTVAEDPDIVMIDYIQELSVDKQYSKADTMPLIGAKLKEFAMVSGVPIIVASQIKNSVLDSDAFTTNQTPFDYGKELNNAAHNSIWLQRQKNDDGTVDSILTAVVTKARDGQLGSIDFEVLPGYKLEEL